MEDFKLIVLDNCKELGNKVNEHLKKIHGGRNYILSISNSRFSNGEGKIKLEESVREKDLYILSDIGNYNISYLLHGMPHSMSPDEHFQDIKRVISAAGGHERQVNLIMPLLYQSRQHKRNGRESLDCALALQELERMGVHSIITFDAHDPNVSNAVPNLPFENFYPTHSIIREIIKNEALKDVLVVSPDMGAMQRARYYAEILGCDVGVFYKRRNLSQVVHGKNPIIEHIYMGSNVLGRDIIIVDDMIASGISILETAKNLKEKGAHHIYFVATFALFTERYEAFSKAFEEKIFDKLYTTNLSYIPLEIKEQEWFYEVDLSMFIASIIDTLNQKKSLDELYNGKLKSETLLTDMNEIPLCLCYYNEKYNCQYIIPDTKIVLEGSYIRDFNYYQINLKRFYFNGFKMIIEVKNYPAIFMRIGIGKNAFLGGGKFNEN